jgi:hypothetical protein
MDDQFEQAHPVRLDRPVTSAPDATMEADAGYTACWVVLRIGWRARGGAEPRHAADAIPRTADAWPLAGRRSASGGCHVAVIDDAMRQLVAGQRLGSPHTLCGRPSGPASPTNSASPAGIPCPLHRKESELIRLDTRARASAHVLLLLSCVTPKEASMAAQTANLYRLEDLDDASKTRPLANSDLAALRTVADWIKRFVTKPHQDLGREGPVCPFVPEALQRKTLWLASEHIAGRSVAEVVQLVNGYQTQLLQQPFHGEGVNYHAIVVVFTDLSADRAKGLFDDVLEHLAVPSYVEDGLVLGGFYEHNEGTAVYNRGFRPFMSPVPFLLMRHAVISDWKFFLDNDAWLNRWAHRSGESAVRALAEELRRLPWRAGGDESHNK